MGLVLRRTKSSSKNNSKRIFLLRTFGNPKILCPPPHCGVCNSLVRSVYLYACQINTFRYLEMNTHKHTPQAVNVSVATWRFGMHFRLSPHKRNQEDCRLSEERKVKVKIKVKVNSTLEQATKAQRGSSAIALLFP